MISDPRNCRRVPQPQSERRGKERRAEAGHHCLLELLPPIGFTGHSQPADQLHLMHHHHHHHHHMGENKPMHQFDLLAKIITTVQYSGSRDDYQYHRY